MAIDLNSLNKNNKSTKRSHSSSTSTSSLNPIIENLLKDPINFKIAKNPDKISIKPSSYIVFKSFKNNTKPSKKDLKEAKETKEIMAQKRPKSMAEAVANYAGKKYSNVANSTDVESKKRKQKNSNSTDQQKEKMRKLLLEQSRNQPNVTKDSGSSEADFPPQQESPQESEQESEQNSQEESETEKESADAASTKLDVVSDEDDEEDDDFHTAESGADSDSGSDEASSSDENSSSDDISDSKEGNDASDDDSEQNEPHSAAVTEESRTVSPESSISALKKALKDDIIKTNEDFEKICKDSLITTDHKLGDFYDLNELENNHGSNSSDKINKSWGDFIKVNHPLGLENHGVTCYMNAAVQSLCHIPSLTRYLLDVQNGKYDDVIKKDSVTRILASTVSKMFKIDHPNKKIVRIYPKRLINRLEDINYTMSIWQQEDSHEYFMSLMSKLQEDSTPIGVKLNESIIYDIFGGLLEQMVTCKNCGHISKTEQEFYDLSIGLENRKKKSSLLTDPQQLNLLKSQIEKNITSHDEERTKLSMILNQRILESVHHSKEDESEEDDAKNQENTQSNNTPSNNEISRTEDSNNDALSTKKYKLENSIKDFFTPEIIKTDSRDQSGYVCEKCHIKTNAIKISTIQRSPETLSVHLKRFRFNGQQSQKVKANVNYPEYLDLTKFTSDMKTPTLYKLNSVIVHQGRSVSSGHYIAHCREPDGTWATYDDDYVNKIPKTEALSDPSAYYLIYERLTFKEIVDKESCEKAKATNGTAVSKKRKAKKHDVNSKRVKTRNSSK